MFVNQKVTNDPPTYGIIQATSTSKSMFKNKLQNFANLIFLLTEICNTFDTYVLICNIFRIVLFEVQHLMTKI